LEDWFLIAYNDRIFCKGEGVSIDWMSWLFIEIDMLEVIWLSVGSVYCLNVGLNKWHLLYQF